MPRSIETEKTDKGIHQKDLIGRKGLQAQPSVQAVILPVQGTTLLLLLLLEGVIHHLQHLSNPLLTSMASPLPAGQFPLLHVITLPCPQDIILRHHSLDPLYRDTLLPLVAGGLHLFIIKEPLHPLAGAPPPLMVHMDHLLKGDGVNPNITLQLEKKEDMRGRERLLPRIGDMTGEMRAEDAKTKTEKEMIEIKTGSQAVLESTEMTENLVMVVIVET